MLTNEKGHTMIEFALEFQYEGASQPTLQPVAGTIEKGRCVVLCGGSGCGKSTLLRCLNGLIPQFYEGTRTGHCRIDGRDTDGMSVGEIGQLAASVFQDPRSQFFTVNSSTEVAFALEHHGLPQEKIQQRVDEAFATFHLEHLKDRNVYQLSSGQRQLVSILAAWAMDTEIFLLDEPTANLDFAAIQQLKTILQTLKAQGKTLLLSEHRLYYLTGVADEYWVMSQGAIQARYTAQQLEALPDTQRQALSLRTLRLADIPVPEKPAPASDRGAALSVEHLRFGYRRQASPLLTDVTFTVQPQEIVGLVGANGCGKTTLGKLVAGLHRPSGGAITLHGQPCPPKQLQKQAMFVMQEAEFQFFTNSVLHELQYGHPITPDFSAKAEALLRRMGMWAYRDRHPFSLSGGQMQKLTLMTACLSDKPVVILDEPTAGQDAESLAQCAALIREMGREKTVLLITHDLELIAQVCHRCIGLSRGQVEREFPVKTQADLAAIRRYLEHSPPAQDTPEPTLDQGRFHPGTKLLFWLVTMVAVSTANNHLAFGVYGALLLLTAADGRWWSALAGGGLLATLWAGAAWLPHTVFPFLLVLFPRIVAVWLSMALLIGRNEASRTLAALRNLHIPEGLIMVVAVIFRFFPVLAGDRKLLHQSIVTRGAFVTLGQKLRALPAYLEILTIPMALRVIRIAETLSASAETRGIALKGRKSNYLTLHPSWRDALAVLVLAAAVVWGVVGTI